MPMMHETAKRKKRQRLFQNSEAKMQVSTSTVGLLELPSAQRSMELLRVVMGADASHDDVRVFVRWREIFQGEQTDRSRSFE